MLDLELIASDLDQGVRWSDETVKALVDEVRAVRGVNSQLIKLSPIPAGEPCPLCGYVQVAYEAPQPVTWPSIEERDREMADHDS